MKDMTVTPKRVREIIAAYGADAARWPAAERAAALAIVRDDAELSALLRDAGWLDAALDSFALPLPVVNAADLAGRIMASASQVPARRRPDEASVPFWRWFGWPKLAGLAMAGVIGFTIGWTGLDAQLGEWMAPGSTISGPVLDAPDALLDGEVSW
jgi:hypothetical protein